MIPQGRKFLVTPDLQKGMITLARTNDNLVNFQWSDRASNSVDNGLILFPDDVEFKKVDTGRSGDRVYMLKWRTGGKVLMFWMQDKSTSKDVENCTKFNEFINNPRAAVDTSNLNTGDGAPGSTDAWMQLLGLGNPPSAAPRRPEAPASAAPPTQSSILGNLDLSSLLQGIPTHPGTAQRPAGPSSSSSAASSAALTSEQLARTLAAMNGPTSRPQNPALQDILAADAVLATGLLEDTQALEAVAQTLPEGQQTTEHVVRTLRSPQLRQAMSALSEGINGETYGTVLANFGVDPGPGTDLLLQGNAVGAFVAAVQAAEDAVAPVVSEEKSGEAPDAPMEED